RHATREVLREPVLALRQQAEREAAGTPQQLVHRRLPVDRDADQRGLERKGHERRDGEAEPLAVGVDRQHGDAVGEPAHELAQLAHPASSSPRRPAAYERQASGRSLRSRSRVAVTVGSPSTSPWSAARLRSSTSRRSGVSRSFATATTARPSSTSSRCGSPPAASRSTARRSAPASSSSGITSSEPASQASTARASSPSAVAST